jgi:hypothetical protein
LPSAELGEAAPARAAHQRPGQQHQQRQETDALEDDPEACGEARRPVPAPVRPEQQVPAQAVQRQRRREHQRRVDLRALELVDELHRAEHRDRRPQAGAVLPQALAQVVHQPQHAQPRAQRRQQEAPAPAAHQRPAGREQPEEQRRLVGVQLDATVREQPLPDSSICLATSTKRGSSAGQGSRSP